MIVGGEKIILDPEDEKRVSDSGMYLVINKYNKTPFVAISFRVNKKTIAAGKLSNWILQCKDRITHINGDPLDLRRINLRPSIKGDLKFKKGILRSRRQKFSITDDVVTVNIGNRDVILDKKIWDIIQQSEPKIYLVLKKMKENSYYAVLLKLNECQKTDAICYLHQFVLTANEHEEIDHINRNKLDNRRVNLRSVTYRVNTQNQSPKRAIKSKGTQYGLYARI